MISSRTARQRGFALLIVLWSLVLLSLILTQLLSAGRSEAQLAANLRNAAAAEAVADGAVQETLFHLMARGAQAWAPAGTHILRVRHGIVTVTIDDLSDKVNPNTADPPILRAMFALCGAPAAQAMRLAQAVLAWSGALNASSDDISAPYRAARMGYAPPGQPMQSLDELNLVAGMTPSLAACVMPHLSLYQQGSPGPQSSDAFVARAVALAVQGGDPTLAGQASAGPPAVQITAAAVTSGGRFVRRATARLAPSDDGRPYRILLWEAPSL